MGFQNEGLQFPTSGLVSAIRKFADQNAPAQLAVSLNATTDDVRTSIMPINGRWSMEELLDAVDYYCKTTDRHVTVEYVMLFGINTHDADLKRLVQLVSKFSS